MLLRGGEVERNHDKILKVDHSREGDLSNVEKKLRREKGLVNWLSAYGRGGGR